MNAALRAPGCERSLADLQHWLFERATRRAVASPVTPVTAPEESAATAADAASRAHPVSDDAPRWLQAGGLAAAQRVEIYRHGYFARLVECLADDYPALAYALGHEAFEALCLDFIAEHPPASASLNFYGAPFAAFCAARPGPLAAFTSDLARLEWAVVEAIHADAEMVLDPSALGRVAEADWPRLRLMRSPTLRVLASVYPIHRYYQAFLDDEGPAIPAPEASALAVSRRGADVWRIGLSPTLAELLDRLIDGAPLARAFEAFEASAACAALDAAELQRAFSEWVACGFFASVLVDRGESPALGPASPAQGQPTRSVESTMSSSQTL
jgi:putative DNA-binding protein